MTRLDTFRSALLSYHLHPVRVAPMLAVLIFGQPLTGVHQRGPSNIPSADSVASEQLVGEAMLIADSRITKHFYLPVTIHGQAASLLLDTGAPSGFLMTDRWFEEHGLSGINTLDSLVIGTTVERHIPLEGDFNIGDIPDVPPVAGLVGNHFLARYDLVFDGPARRVRLYAPSKSAPPEMVAARAVVPHRAPEWLPPGITIADCMPMIHHGAPDDRYPGLDLRANGQVITGTFDSGANSTNMNLAAIKLMGIQESNPNMHLVPADSIQVNYAGAAPQNQWIVSTGLIITLGSRPLPDGPIHVFQTVNEIYGDPAQPEAAIGTELLHDRILFVSYSSGQVCLSAPMSHTP